VRRTPLSRCSRRAPTHTRCGRCVMQTCLSSWLTSSGYPAVLSHKAVSIALPCLLDSLLDSLT
jgi:hypothetical protein